jgi:hypothetical protein
LPENCDSHQLKNASAVSRDRKAGAAMNLQLAGMAGFNGH